MTDAFYIDKRDNVVLPRLKERGLVMYLIEASGTFDERTGEYTEDPSPTRTETYGMVLETKVMSGGVGSEMEGAMTRRVQKKVMMAATNLKTPPTTDMVLEISSVEHEVISVLPFAPGGLDVYYDLVVAT